MTGTTIVVAVVLAGWLAATVVWNIRGLDAAAARVLPRGRWLQLIPSWSFFAPRPASQDSVLLVRDRYDSGRVSIWREVANEGTPWSPVHALWNPDSRPRKAFSDAVTHLAQIVTRHPEEMERSDTRDALVISVPYLLILNKISGLPADLGVTGRQFMIGRYSRVSDEPQFMFVSRMHDLEPAGQR